MARKTQKKKGGQKFVRGRPKTFNQAVMRIINNTRELKVATMNTHSNQNVIKGILGTGLQRIMPEINQGNGEYNRVGNTIRLMKLVVRGYYEVVFPVSSYADQRLQLRQFILKQKGCGARMLLDDPGNFSQNNLLENSQPYTGTPMNFCTPVNKGAFVARRDRRWTLKTGIQSADPTNNQQVGNKTFVYFTHTLTFGKNGKKLTYKTAGETDSEQFDYVLADSVNQMGLDDEPSTSVLRTFQSTAYYTDA